MGFVDVNSLFLLILISRRVVFLYFKHFKFPMISFPMTEDTIKQNRRNLKKSTKFFSQVAECEMLIHYTWKIQAQKFRAPTKAPS